MRLTATLLSAMLFIGCASNNGDSAADDPATAEPTTHAEHATKDEGDDAPAFDASIPDESPDGGNQTPTDPPPPSGNQCIDKDDSGGSETLAKKLGDIDDCDGSGTNVKGVMNGAVDVDFYKVHAADTFGCVVNPHFSSTAPGLEVCVFVKCDNNGTTSVSGCGNGAAKTSDIGDPGCCFATPGTVDISLNCSGVNDSAELFVKVSQNGGDKCEPYQIDYHN